MKLCQIKTNPKTNTLDMEQPEFSSRHEYCAGHKMAYMNTRLPVEIPLN